MKCKYCEAELAQWGAFCPNCGKKNEEASLLDEQDVIIGEEEETCDCPEAVIPETEETEAPSPALKKAKRMAAMSGCVALLAVLATVLFFGIRGGWEVEKWFDWLKPRENTVAYKDSYTVDDKKAAKKADVVVATLGDGLELTNAQLQIHYWSEVYTFLENYYYYLSYIGFDYTKPLDEQACYFDANMTWQQYFLQSAIDAWHSNVAFAEQAKANGFELPEDYRKSLDDMETELQETATKGGYASLDAMVQKSFGAGVTFADYQEYMELYYLSYTYFESLYNEIDPSMEDLEEYFAANEETLTGSGIKKDGSYTIDVRHILVMIDNVVKEMEKTEGDAATQAETEYTEEQWAACLAEAQRIYEEWLAGEQTEERFGELANKYSHDNNGEVTNGGIYTFVEKGDMVEDFNTWCFTEGRQPGDTDIVKTKFGYHVMYFVGSEETWVTGTRSAYISAESNKIVTSVLSKYSIEIDYKKIVLANVAL